MTEPATTIAGAALGAAGATALSALGIEPAPLFWAVIGGCIGVSFAGSTSRARAVLLFIVVALACSVFGAYLAQTYTEGKPLTRNVFACLLAIAFHPLLNAAITRLPALLDGLMRKFGIGGQP